MLNMSDYTRQRTVRPVRQETWRAWLGKLADNSGPTFIQRC